MKKMFCFSFKHCASLSLHLLYTNIRSHSICLFDRINSLTNIYTHVIACASMLHQIIASDSLHVADACFFFIFFCLCVFFHQMCVIYKKNFLFSSRRTIQSQYFPLVLTTQSEIQWAENNLASAHSCALCSFSHSCTTSTKRMKRKEWCARVQTTRWILI